MTIVQPYYPTSVAMSPFLVECPSSRRLASRPSLWVNFRIFAEPDDLRQPQPIFLLCIFAVLLQYHMKLLVQRQLTSEAEPRSTSRLAAREGCGARMQMQVLSQVLLRRHRFAALRAEERPHSQVNQLQVLLQVVFRRVHLRTVRVSAGERLNFHRGQKIMAGTSPFLRNPPLPPLSALVSPESVIGTGTRRPPGEPGQKGISLPA